MFNQDCMARIQECSEKALKWAPLAIRLTLGIVFMAHGADKLFNTFGGGGLQATAEQFESLGLHPGMFHAIMGGGGEFLGGLLVFLGLLTRIGGFLVASTMVVAILTVHLSHGLFARDGGFEYPLVALGAALSLVLSGGGMLSLDCMLKSMCCKGKQDA